MARKIDASLSGNRVAAVPAEEVPRPQASRYENVGRRRNEQDAILRKMHVYAEYPYCCISSEALAMLQAAGASSPLMYVRKNVSVVLKALECYLAVTGQKLQLTSTGRVRLGRVRNDFIGAIFSDRFLCATQQTRDRWAHTWSHLANRISADFGVATQTISFNGASGWPRRRKMNPKLLEAVKKFDNAELIASEVTRWTAWPVVNLQGSWTWIPLHRIFPTYGEEFTSRLYDVCCLYFSTRRDTSIPLFNRFTEFMRLEWSPEKRNLNSPEITDEFFNKFIVYSINSMKDIAQYHSLRHRWVGFVDFASGYLCASNLFAKPASGFTKLPYSVKNSNVKINKDGTIVNTKLLLEVPLHLTDQAALEILMKGLDSQIEIIAKWARYGIDEIWENHQRRLRLAKIGKARTYNEKNQIFIGCSYLTDISNPLWLENCAATFEINGFHPWAEGHSRRALYSSRLPRDFGYQLGLPTTRALIPHLSILVANHPELTPSLLEKLKLYDTSGHECLLKKNGEYHIMTGVKMRRGASRAEQEIRLNDQTDIIIAQVIELTRPLREYLKAQGDSNWRLLFLACGKGFSYPRPLKISGLTSGEMDVSILSKELQQKCEINAEAAFDISRRFSLPRLRATVAVSAYIKRPDIGVLSRNLGHANVDIKLLRSYLPDALLDFFQERWIRLFQCGLLSEALTDSKWKLPATGFDTEAELDEFLLNHRLRLRPTGIEYADSENAEVISARCSDEDEVVFCIDVEVLTLFLHLCAIHKATPRAMTATATYWATFGNHIIEEIRNAEVPREDLQAILREAEIMMESAGHKNSGAIQC